MRAYSSGVMEWSLRIAERRDGSSEMGGSPRRAGATGDSEIDMPVFIFSLKWRFTTETRKHGEGQRSLTVGIATSSFVGSTVVEPVSSTETIGWRVREAGVTPALPRNCERSESCWQFHCVRIAGHGKDVGRESVEALSS